MKKALERISNTVWHYEAGHRIDGAPTGISGDLSGIRGNLTSITGTLTGIRGDLSGIRGDIDDCQITDEERGKGINVNDLIN